MPHIHDKIDFTVEVFIVFKNRVLLRKHDKYGIWLSVGGHIELDEDPNQTAMREVQEEVGLNVELVGSKRDFSEEGYTDLISPRFLNRHRISDTHEHVTLTYFAKSGSDKITLSTTEKSSGWKWFSADELVDPAFGLKGAVKYYALTALREVK